MASVSFCTVVSFLFCMVYVDAGQKCHGSPRMYKGKRCASTTFYHDGRKGACGCGPDHTDKQFWWNRNSFVTAPNQHLFDSGGKTWCGGVCGKCFRLTTTGGWINGQGEEVPEGQSYVFMATNLCPNKWPNLAWCSQSWQNGYKNKYGYGAHFDLEDGAGQIAAIGWKGKNPEVTWEWSDCYWPHKHDRRTPNDGMYSQCYCSRHPGGEKK
ncbi:endoglucanase-like [Mercenaria mercenaria]|uniref:endoglucanase-like n=1 Tax=Mercenaria mercenaria TaxID=6596 RepID=UPI00234F0AEF|nr:endoglucanase-like [Mercenaria mercenaria]